MRHGTTGVCRIKFLYSVGSTSGDGGIYVSIFIVWLSSSKFPLGNAWNEEIQLPHSNSFISNPNMTEYERTVLEHYQLASPYPVEWPAEKDDSDASDEDEAVKPNRALRRSKSIYSALERVAIDRKSLIPGSQKTGDGVENLVQRDESDPLGATDSVVRVLRNLGLPVSDDTRLREYTYLWLRA